MNRQRLKVQTPDGRNLEVEVAGPEGGDVVFHHTGTPGAGMIYGPLLEAGAERGLRHVSYCRPGYAGSDRVPGRRIGDCAADTAAILDSLDVERFYVTGQSGGGPHSLACAALLGDRVRSAASTAGVAPYDAEGLDWLAGMGQENLDEMAAAEAGDAELEAFLEKEAETYASVDAGEVAEALGDLVSESDKAVVNGELAEHMVKSLRASLSTGIWGWFDDDKAHSSDWGFDIDSIAVPVTIWQGGDDRMVPAAHGRWLAAHVPGAEGRLLEGEGHLSLNVAHYGDVLDQLIASGD